MNRPAWQYDELRHSGVDYSDPSQAAVYDERHQRFRDYRKDAEARMPKRQPGFFWGGERELYLVFLTQTSSPARAASASVAKGPSGFSSL